MDRRELLLATAAAFGLAEANASAAEKPASGRKSVFQQALPDLKLEDWQVTALELTFSPGVTSPKHHHPGFVLGYVLEGEYRFQLQGEKERIIRAGEMFYEPPGAVHTLSESANPSKPVKVLALVFGNKNQPISTPD